MTYGEALYSAAVGGYKEREYRDEERGGMVRASMRPCRIRKELLETAPSVGEKVSMEDGRVMRVHSVTKDPTDEAWAMWLVDRTEVQG